MPSRMNSSPTLTPIVVRKPTLIDMQRFPVLTTQARSLDSATRVLLAGPNEYNRALLLSKTGTWRRKEGVGVVGSARGCPVLKCLLRGGETDPDDAKRAASTVASPLNEEDRPRRCSRADNHCDRDIGSDSVRAVSSRRITVC
jgi:hypothetical protein